MRLKQIFIRGVGTLLVILLIIAGYFWWQYETLKPSYGKNENIPGIFPRVAVGRDSSGVIHLEAANEKDLITAMGYEVASERLWQMDLLRRIGQGRLSEVFGDTTLNVDRLFLTLGLDSIAARNWKQASPKSRQWLQWYATGVNAYLNKVGKNLPIEFQLLRFKPDAWRPQDALIIQRVFAWILNFSWKTDFIYNALQEKLSARLFRSILPVYGAFPNIVKTGSFSKGRVLPKFFQLDAQFREFFRLPPTGWGSNSWAISGEISQSGKALLANDPHLELRLPSVWIELQLKCPVLNVSGFSIPGTPGIVIGRNDSLAWGLTNGMVDDSDYFIEKVDTLKKVYFQGSRSYPLKVQIRKIHSRDGERFVKTMRTRHGPLLNSLFPDIRQKQWLALRWTGADNSDDIVTFYKLARAKNWKNFREALSHYSLPAQNFVYADARGNIGYQLAGKIPLRRGRQGLLPRDGSDKRSDWQGFVPFTELPFSYNPESHRIVTANNRIVANFPYYLSDVWEPPFRAQRIEELINLHSDSLNVAAMKAIQQDVFNPLSRVFLPGFLKIIAGSSKLDSLSQKADIVHLLESWDGQMTPESVSAAVFEVWQWNLIRDIFEDEMGEVLFRRFATLQNFYLRIYFQIMSKNNSLWFDNIKTAGIIENRQDMIIQSFRETLEFLKRRLGREMYRWEWGALHQLNLEHSLGSVLLLRPVFNVGPFAMGGNPLSVNVATYAYDSDFQMKVGPSMRFIMDWSKPGEYLSILPGGESGNPFSEYYSNQTSAWRVGKYKKVGFDSSVNFIYFNYLFPENKK